MKFKYKGHSFDSDEPILIGRDLKIMRVMAGVNTTVAAEYLGVKSRKTIENWESSKSQPGINNFVMMCRRYGFNPALVIQAAIERTLDPTSEKHEVSLNFEACRTHSGK